MNMQVINSKAPGGFRPLTADEIIAVSGGGDFAIDEEGSVIVVTGPKTSRITDTSFIPSNIFGGGYDLGGLNFGGLTFGDGGGGSVSDLGETTPHCNASTDAVAEQFANNQILGTHPLDFVGAPDISMNNPTWLNAEIIGFLGPNGQSGVTVINTNPDGGYRPDFGLFPGAIEGFIHNHPRYTLDSAGNYVERDAASLLNNRYPSNGDWNVLQAISTTYGVADPALYLVDPFGVVREFKLSERQAIQDLDDTQRQAGVGLESREIGQQSGGTGC